MFNFQKKFPYYGENGITASSANYIANLGKETYRTILKELADISFYTTQGSIPGIEGEYVVSRSIPEETFTQIPVMLKKVYKINALIGWLREAIKWRQSMMAELGDLSTEDYAKISDRSAKLELSQRKYLSLQRETILPDENWDADKAWDYLHNYERLNTFSNASTQFATKLKDVEEVQGRTTPLNCIANSEDKLNRTICTSLTAPLDVLSAMSNEMINGLSEKIAAFEPLKKEYDEQLREQCDSKSKTQTELERQIESYHTTLYNQTKIYRADERRRVSKLRIIIPESLKPVFDELSTLHDQQKK